MKKGISVIIILVMILSMIGCGTQNVESGETGKQDSILAVEPQPIPESSSEQTNESTTDKELTEGELTSGPAYLDISLEPYWDNEYEDMVLMNACYNSVNLHTGDYPALTDAVNKFNSEYISETQSYINELKENTRSEYEEYGAQSFMGPYEYQSRMFVKRADDEALAIEELVYSYEGGAHGNSFFKTYNFDVQTGAEIALENVVIDKDSLPVILETEIIEKYPDLTFWTDSLEELFREYIVPTDTQYPPTFTWTLGYDGVTFYFSDYEIGSYADGVQQVTLCYNEYPQIFDDRYFKNADENYVIAFDNTWDGMDTDLNGDGVTDYISVTRNYDIDVDYSESFNVTVNGNTFTQETYCYDLETYLVKSGNRHYLYVQRTVENDYQSVCVFEITEISVEYMGEFNGGMTSFTNSADFEVVRRMDVLSTYSALANCYVGEDGMPVEKEGVYQVQDEISITSTVEITADLVDEEGNLIGDSYAFPAGTDFQFMTTDGETFADMLADDGKRCRFYTGTDWPPTVNGMNADESFEMLWYAG